MEVFGVTTVIFCLPEKDGLSKTETKGRLFKPTFDASIRIRTETAAFQRLFKLSLSGKGLSNASGIAVASKVK